MIILIVLLVLGQVMTDRSVDKLYNMTITSFKDEMSSLSDLHHVASLILNIENDRNLPSNAFNNGNLTNLKELHIKGYSLQAIENDAFNGLTNIKSLIISYTNIEIIDTEMFNQLSNLESLDLESNSIKTINGNFTLPSLKNLDLRHNKLETIDQHFFQNIPNVESVDLRDNLLMDINVAAFGLLTKLNTLYLSDNRLDASKYRLANVFKEFGFTICPVTIDNLSISKEGCENVAFKMVLMNFAENLNTLYVITNLFDVVYEQRSKEDFEKLVKPLEIHSNWEFGRYNMTIYKNTAAHKYALVLDKHIRVLPSNGFDGLSEIEQLYLGRNNITIVEDDAFSGLSNLRYLELYHNNIEIIHTETFNQLRNLRSLNVKANYIATIHGDFDLPSLELLDLSHNRLMAIGQTFFHGISNLGIVFLANNLLEHIHDESFDPLTKLNYLDLRSNSNLDVSATQHQFVKSIQESDAIMCPLIPDDLFFSINACENLPVKTLISLVSEHVENLYIITKELLESNIKILQHLNKTNDVYFRSHSITKYKNNPLHTNALVLDRYNLSVLPSNCFNRLSELKALHLPRNNITTLESGVFSGLLKLTLLNLEHNQISIINENDFNELRNLTHLNLNSNLIRYVHDDFNLPSLNTLNLSNNRLVIIDDNFFKNLPNVEYLDLSANFIKYINMESLKRLTKVKYFDMTNNYLQNPDNDQFGKIFNESGIRMCPLTSDSLSFATEFCYNTIATTMLDFAENVQSLYIITDVLHESNRRIISPSGNSTELQFGEHSMRLYKNLQKYTLLADKYDMSVLPSDGFSSLSRLKNLYLSTNNITIIENGAFNGLFRLKYLFLSRNKIETINTEAFNQLNKLVLLDLQLNSIRTICTNFNLPSLHTLKLGYNRLNAIDRDFFQNISNLERVLLNNNFIKCMNKNSIKRLTKLKSFDLTDNPLNPDNYQFGRIFKESGIKMCPLTSDSLSFSIEFCYNIIRMITSQLTDNVDDLSIISKLHDANGQHFIFSSKHPFLQVGNYTIISFQNNNTQILYVGADKYIISVLPSDGFSRLSILQNLTLSNNGIKIIEDGAFNGLLKLENLYLSNNKIQIINTETFNVLKTLVYLDLQQNSIKTISGNFNLPFLQRLDLSDNRLKTIDQDFLQNVPILNWVDLSSNSLRDINPVTVRLLNKLKYLDISNNN